MPPGHGVVVASLVRNSFSMHGQLSGRTLTSWPRNYLQLSLVVPSGAHYYPRRKFRFIAITVSAINKGSSKDKTGLHLLRCLWFFEALFQIKITATHIPGVDNVAADLLSRNLLTQLWAAYPQAAQFPTYVPIPLLELLSPMELDWTSHRFLSLFMQTLSIVYKRDC